MQGLSEENIRQILALSPAIVYTCKADGDFGATFVSDNIQPLFGYSPDDCLNQPTFWRDNIHPDDVERVFSAYDALFEEDHHVHEYRFRKKDGSYAWVLDELKLVRDEQGKPSRIIGSWLDISDRKEAVDSLRNSEKLFRVFFEDNPFPALLTTLDGEIEAANRAFLHHTNYQEEDVRGHNSLELFWKNPDDRQKMVAAIKEQGFVDNFESEFYDQERNPRVCLVSCRIVELEGQTRLLNTIIDITEKKNAEESLRKSELLFRLFFDANPIPTIISSAEGIVLMVNPAFTRNPGFTPEEVVGKSVKDLGFWRIPEDRERMVAAIRERGYIDNLESQFYGRGQRPMTCLISSRAIEYENEVRILSIVLDVTEQRKAEAAMRSLEQAKSDFISTAAHELRTPLVAIIGYCELLENAAEMGLSDKQKNEFLDVIHSNAGVLNRLVDDLLDIGRIQIGRSLGITRKDTDLLSLVEKVVASSQLKSGRHEIVVEPGPDIPRTVSVDPGRIAQVLNNLLSNAIKFSPAGGIIKVRVDKLTDRVEVAVIDGGIGMTTDQVEHIFERFYRVDKNSEESLGLGLGLSIVKQIIVDHDGQIEVQSIPGKGTTVKFSLPWRP